MSKNFYNSIIETDDKSDDLQDNLDKVIDVVAKCDEVDTAIKNYYNAVKAQNNDAIADSQIEIMKALFGFGDYIPDTCGGWFWDLYIGVFDKSTEIFKKRAEEKYIGELLEEAAVYIGTNPEPYEYYGKILENFDEYYAKKIALKKALKESESQTAIASFYEEYQKAKNPSSIWEIINDWIWKEDDIPLTYNLTIPQNTKNAKKTYVSASNQRYDPLILDLDGDGFNVETKENGTNFDLDKNGLAEKINWTKKDGILCLDLNGNGKVDNGGEVFGDWTMLPDGARAKNGFEALAQYDSNGDGVIDADDEIFDSLRIWVDADGDGISGEGELKTLAELGIVSINLSYENVNAETGTEALIGNTATFTRADGTIGKAGELWVSADLFDTEDRLDVEVSDEIAALPYVKSIGNVYSLHSAIALDETGELKALVESFISEEDADKRIAITEQILFFISGAKNIAANSRGEYIDARQLAVIEAMLGEKYEGTTGANPHSNAAPMLKSAYQDLLNMYYNELNAQTHIKDYAALLRYTENDDGTKTLNADLVNFILEYQLEKDDENAKKMLTEVARYVQYLDNGGIKGINSFIMNYAVISAEYAAEIVKIMPNGYAADGENPLNGTSNGDFLVGSNNNDEIYGYSGNDTLIGGKGDDTLYGSYGDDTYVFNLGDGNDVINEKNTNSVNDRVVFGEGISAEDIDVIRSGNDMVLKIKDTEDSLRIVSQYCNNWYWIENFEFADGTVLTVNDLHNVAQTIHGSGVIEDFTSGYGNRNNTLVGSDESDSLYGYDGNDTLIGGKGDDYLYGGVGDDTYIFNLGDGNDVIDEQNTNSVNDRVVFGEGISAEDIDVIRSGNDMVLKIKDTEDSLRIVRQYNNSYNWIENFEFADGTVLTVNDLFNVAQTIHGSGVIEDFTKGYGNRNNTLIGSDESDSLYGYDGNDTLIGGKGDDYLYGGVGDDTYVFNLGDGNDVIDEQNTNSVNDRVVFGEGISAEDIKVERSGNNMIVRYSENDSITLINQYSNDYYWIENFEFADGSKRTINDFLNVAQIIHGSGKLEDFTKGHGNRNNTLIGSDESDSLYGYDGNDTLIGGKGDDILYGGWEDDTYIFNLGDGNDIIEDYVASNLNSKADKVIFGEGISVEDIDVIRSGNDMVLKIKDTDDSLRIVRQYNDNYYWIENFEFADGSKRTINDFLNVAQIIHGSGKLEDFTKGYGNRNNTLVGSDESDSLYGYDGNDTLIGGKGDDTLYGSYGDDTYVFNLGDGNDVIDEQNTNSANDRVVFGEGISAEDIKVERSGNNMIVRYSENDSITLLNQYSNDYYWIENFEFADGSKRTINDFLNVAQIIHGNGKLEDFTKGHGNRNNTLIGSDESDSLYGYDGNDTLIGGKGDDTLYGGWEDDTYIFNLGDGNDIIEDYVASDLNSKADKVIFGEGIFANDIIFECVGRDMKISYGNSSDSIVIVNQCRDSWYYIENFETSDGYSISNTQVNLLIQSMAAFEADTGMSWAEAAEQSNEAYSDIISQMWVKSVS